MKTPSNFKDMTHQKFGRLSVLQRAQNDKHNRTRWLCVCDCGNQKIITRKNLQNGDTRSCGCLRRMKGRTPSNFKDITHKKFGRLTVLERHAARTKQGGIQWLCICECGSHAVVSGASLKRKRFMRLSDQRDIAGATVNPWDEQIIRGIS